MRKIYNGAASVLIWLGDEVDESSMAFELIPRLSRTVGTDIGSWTAKERRALEALLSRPWFGRMWILQELGEASSAFLVCGDRRVHWQYVSGMIEHMYTEA